MNEKQYERLEASIRQSLNTAVEPAIKTYVNGKIEKMDTKLDVHIKEHKEDIADVKESIKVIQADIQPVVRAFAWWKITIILLIALLSVAANFAQIASLFVKP